MCELLYTTVSKTFKECKEKEKGKEIKKHKHNNTPGNAYKTEKVSIYACLVMHMPINIWVIPLTI